MCSIMSLLSIMTTPVTASATPHVTIIIPVVIAPMHAPPLILPVAHTVAVFVDVILAHVVLICWRG